MPTLLRYWNEVKIFRAVYLEYFNIIFRYSEKEWKPIGMPEHLSLHVYNHPQDRSYAWLKHHLTANSTLRYSEHMVVIYWHEPLSETTIFKISLIRRNNSLLSLGDVCYFGAPYLPTRSAVLSVRVSLWTRSRLRGWGVGGLWEPCSGHHPFWSAFSCLHFVSFYLWIFTLLSSTFDVCEVQFYVVFVFTRTDYQQQ